MNGIKSIFAILILIVSMPAHASEENTLQIENITSISSIVNPATLDLAKSVKAAPERRNFIPPQAFWSPDGNKLLVRSSIGWYRGDIDFRPSNRNGIDAIYVMDPDGTNLTKIVSNEINNRSTPIALHAPQGNPWSPEGSKIAFISLENGAKLYAINPDGTGKTLLTTNLSWSWTNPYAWSPSGDKIAFSSSITNGEHILIANPDGTERVQITTGENKHYSLIDMGGSWSPDGSRLLIESSNEVFIAKLSGYDRSSAIKQGYITANESIQELPGKSSPEPTLTAATQITNHAASTPKAPGFDVVLAIAIISTIYLFKRRYN